MERYKYRPLSSTRQIRLLRLFAGANDDELSGELFHTSLVKAPPFIALSYVWGDPQPRKGIRCCGFVAEVGPSLHSALLGLRQPDRDVPIWADAICINQEDDSERGEQVKMMGEIYAAASWTAIWLGEKSREVSRAFVRLRRLDGVLTSIGRNPPSPRDGEDVITNEEMQAILQMAFGKYWECALHNFWALLDRPWFRRKWIIQELVKSQRPVLMTGRKYLPWSMLSAWLSCIHLCRDLGEVVLGYRGVEGGERSMAGSLEHVNFLRKIRNDPEGRNLLLLVARTLRFRCAELHDHVYALMGIASDANQFDLIDYKISANELCIRLAYACVSDSANLQRLWELVSLTPLKDRINSWVPNLERVVADMNSGVLLPLFGMERGQDYEEVGDSALETSLDPERNMLRIRGRIVDEVKIVGSNIKSLINSQRPTQIINNGPGTNERLWQRIMQHWLRWLAECTAIVEATMSENGKEAFTQALFTTVATARQDFSILRDLKIFGRCDSESLTAAAETGSYIKSWQMLDSILIDKVQRRFGGTKNSSIGWLPLMAEEGDFICIFDGMELPYVIRSAGDGRYLLVGDCIMRGSMMSQSMLLPKMESQIIELQ
ncbi:hypothetical protein PspLS_09233 [Pyricularia sp. CBS 133598]|nr:hypothetical protein PspLS_09233 [Pyricularia sp. CBS 133598]